MGKRSQKRRAQEAQKQAEFKAQQQAGMAALGSLIKKAVDVAAPRPATVMKTVAAPVAKPAPMRPSAYSAVVIRRPGNEAAKKIMPAHSPTHLDPSRERLMQMAARPIAMNKNVIPANKAEEPKKATMPMTFQSSMSRVMQTSKMDLRPNVAAKAAPQFAVNNAINNANGSGGNMVSKQKQNKGMFAALKYIGVMAICATLAVGGYLGYQAVSDAAPAVTNVSAYSPKTVSTHDSSFQHERPVMRVVHSEPIHQKAPIAKISAKKHHAHAKAIKTAKKHHGHGKKVKAVKVSAKKAKGKKAKKVRV